MKKLLLLITFLLSIACANAQSPTFQWVKGTGATSKISVYSGNSIAVDAAGNVYTTGCFIGTVDFDPGAGTYNLTSDTTDNIFISKLDASGNFVWAKEMSGTGSSNSGAGTSIVVDATGNVYTTGCFSGTIDFDPGVGIVNLTSGLGGQETFISKLDASGNFVWAKKISGAGSGDSSFGNSIAIDAADNVYTTGSFQGTIDFDPGAGTFDITSGVGGMDIFISKLDASGSFVWAKQMPCAWGASENAGSIAIDAAGKIYTTGYFHGTIDFDPGAGTFNLNAINTDIFISKLDASGNFVWAKNMGGSGSSDSGYGSSIAVDSADNVYSMGYFYGTVDFDPGVGIDSLTAVGTTNMFVSKLDAYGDFVWAKNIGGSATSYSQGYSLALDIADNVYTTGAFIGTVDFDPGAGIDSLTSNTSGDIFISKLDGSGNFVWAVQMGGASSYIQGCSITVDASNNIYTLGPFDGTIDFDPGAGVVDLTSVGVSAFFVHKMSQTSNDGVNEYTNNNNISIYPNPTNGSFNIFTSEKIKNGRVEVYNSLGVLVCNKQIANEQTAIELNDQANGLYFVKMMSEGKIIDTHKIIKEN